VVAETVGGLGDRGVVVVVVVRAVDGVVLRQTANSNRLIPNEEFLNLLNIALGMVLVAKFRGDGQGNQGVASEPLLVVMEGGKNQIFINSSGVFAVVVYSFFQEKVSIEVVGYFVSPFFKFNEPAQELNSFIAVVPAFVERLQLHETNIEEAN
jgi:hypothetical protein